MTPAQLEAIAEYFSGNPVACASVMLELPALSAHRKAAESFFACRQALGLHGYLTKMQCFEVLNAAE